MSSLKTLPASQVPSHVVHGGILDDSWGEECDRGCVVAGEDLDSPPFISRINNIVSTNNRTFDSRQNLQNRGGELEKSSRCHSVGLEGTSLRREVLDLTQQMNNVRLLVKFDKIPTLFASRTAGRVTRCTL